MDTYIYCGISQHPSDNAIYSNILAGLASHANVAKQCSEGHLSCCFCHANWKAEQKALECSTRFCGIGKMGYCKIVLPGIKLKQPWLTEIVSDANFCNETESSLNLIRQFISFSCEIASRLLWDRLTFCHCVTHSHTGRSHMKVSQQSDLPALPSSDVFLKSTPARKHTVPLSIGLCLWKRGGSAGLGLHLFLCDVLPHHTEPVPHLWVYKYAHTNCVKLWIFFRKTSAHSQGTNVPLTLVLFHLFQCLLFPFFILIANQGLLALPHLHRYCTYWLRSGYRFQVSKGFSKFKTMCFWHFYHCTVHSPEVL